MHTKENDCRHIAPSNNGMSDNNKQHYTDLYCDQPTTEEMFLFDGHFCEH